jgi:hypothetical protein
MRRRYRMGVRKMRTIRGGTSTTWALGGSIFSKLAMILVDLFS